MDLNNNTVQISSARQLIAINRNSDPFQAEFTVTSQNNEPFRALIVSQTILDSLNENSSLEMKEVPRGVFSGTMTESSEPADQWYVALESDKPMNAQIHIQLAPLPPEQQQQAVAGVAGAQSKTKAWLFRPWTLVGLGILLLIVGYFVYRYFFWKADNLAPADPLPFVPEVAEIVAPPPPPVAVAVSPVVVDLSDLPAL